MIFFEINSLTSNLNQTLLSMTKMASTVTTSTRTLAQQGSPQGIKH